MITKKSLIDDVGLLATDLDGTLIGHKPEFGLYNTFRDKMFSLRARQGTAWVVCTGRSMKSFRSVFLPMRSFGIAPDFVITCHAYLFSRRPWGFRPHLLWNLRIKEMQWRHSRRVRRAIPRLRRLIRSRFPFARIVVMGHERICFAFDAPEFADAAAHLLRASTQRYRYLRVFEYRNQVDVRSVPFTKGLALSELARHIGVQARHVLAIGDGHNDASMMDPTVARFVACPANAEPEIIRLVHEAGGHVARNRALAGVIEIIEAYETGRVNSDIPTQWRDPTEVDSPIRSSLPSVDRTARSPIRGFLLLLASIYTVLLVLAYFEAIPPGVAAKVLTPYNLALKMVGRMFPRQLQF